MSIITEVFAPLFSFTPKLSDGDMIVFLKLFELKRDYTGKA